MTKPNPTAAAEPVNPQQENCSAMDETFERLKRSSHNRWIATWIIGAMQWAVFEGTSQHRDNCIALLNEAIPDWRKTQ